MSTITIKTPSGTTGLAVEPWSKGELYAVAADWAQASSPVLVYGEDGWTSHGRQVADFRHRARAALESIIREAISMGGDEPDDDEVDGILDDAEEIDSISRYIVGDSGSTDSGLTYAEAVDRIGEWYEDICSWGGDTPDEETERAVRDAIESVKQPRDDGDLQDLRRYADDIRAAVAEAMGAKDFYGHGNYSVSAADSIGLNLTAEEDA